MPNNIVILILAITCVVLVGICVGLIWKHEWELELVYWKGKNAGTREFAENLKEKYKGYDNNVGVVCKGVLFNDIDNLVKEYGGDIQ